MTSESKILTVSYGTFSCTLEGFDDPFNTMKAVAEYFRDLAAEDRYFGSEPPVPDAAMLHRIAEREVQRMVEARVQGNGIFLRQQDGGTAGLTAAPAPLPPTVDPAPPAALAKPAPSAPSEADKQRLSEKAQDGFAADAAEDDSLPILKDVIPGGVAAKLARIRQSVNSNPGVPVLTPETLAAFAVPPTADKAEPTAEAAPAQATELEPEMTASEADIDTAAVGDALSRLLSMPDEAPSEIVAQVDSRLVGEAPVAIAGTDPDAADEAIAAETDIAIAGEDASERAPSNLDVLAETEEMDAAGNDAEAGATGIEGTGAEAPSVAAPALLLSDALLLTDDVAVADAAVVPPDAADILPEDRPEDPEAEIAAAQTATPAAVDDADPAAVIGKGKRTLSRILRMQRTDAPSGTNDDPENAADRTGNGEEAEVSRLLRHADDEMADANNRRRLDAIAHLKAAVAATEAERAVTGEAINPPGAKIEPYRDDLAQVVQPTEPEPELPVKPRRKTGSVGPQEPRPGTIRPGMVGPPPLVLVSEQRIDRTPPTGQPMVAVRSGRLSGAIGAGAATPLPQRSDFSRPGAAPAMASGTDHDDEDEDADDNIFVDEAGFSTFAEKVGVKSMADMLEAAAAYATCMEQRDQFTRPQLMRRLIASSAGKPVSREDGLRSFGTLLRTGRIEKVSRGHYALAANSPYLAEARRMAT